MASMSQAGVDMLKRFEGLRLVAYRDIVHVLTIGYGHTGHDVYEGQTITDQQAEDLLRADLARFEQAVQNALTRPWTQNQFDAMVSLCYNIGIGNRADASREIKPRGFLGSSVLRFFNAGDLENAATSFIMWVNAGRKLQPILITRRAQEIVRFLRP